MNYLRHIGALFRRGPHATVSTPTDDRVASYELWDSYYAGTAYEPAALGGHREWIKNTLGELGSGDVASFYNPVRGVVDLYQHVLGGTFGDTIRVESGEQATAITEPLQAVWRWSNMQVAKQLICRWSALHGNVGLRIVVRNDIDPARRRVFIKPEHPRIVKDIDLDERGNVERILLEYVEEVGVGDDRRVITIQELQTKTEFTIWEIESGIKKMREQYENALGVVPYVWLSHEASGGRWSGNAISHALPLIDHVNALQTHISTQIHHHVRAKWLVAYAGPPLASFDFGDLSVVHADTRNASGQTSITPLVAPLNLADAITQSRQLIEQIEDALPELKALAGRFLSNQSGETVAQLRKPAEDRLALARAQTEDALVRAQQIALSYGVLHQLWDVGTGMGTVDAADRAYREGYEDHRFNSRDLLPLTEGERVALARDKQAAGWSRRYALAAYGLTDTQLDRNETELRDEQITATDAYDRVLNRGLA